MIGTESLSPFFTTFAIMPHKAGFVNIIGKPNVGKSTLMNALVGEKLAIITPKAQTTRQRILGIVNADDYQVVFSDTPGIIQPGYKLQEAMMREVESAFEDADVLLFLVEAGELPELNSLTDRIGNTGIPVILVINKIDLSDQATVELKMQQWREIFPEADIIPVSALLNVNMASIFQRILELIP